MCDPLLAARANYKSTTKVNASALKKQQLNMSSQILDESVLKNNNSQMDMVSRRKSDLGSELSSVLPPTDPIKFLQQYFKPNEDSASKRQVRKVKHANYMMEKLEKKYASQPRRGESQLLPQQNSLLN